MNITKISLPKKGFTDTWFITNDWHSYYFHKPCLHLLIKTAKDTPKKRRKLVINGDFLDFKWLYKKDEEYQFWKNQLMGVDDFFIKELQKETTWGNEVLDELQKHFSEIIFLDGNHEYRLDVFRKSNICPAVYKSMFTVCGILKLKERNIKYVKYNAWVDIGKMSITHGMFHGTTALKKHYEACGGRSVCFGHLHQRASKSFFTRGSTHEAFMIPCMSTLNPDYLKNTENNWAMGFATLNVIYDGTFWFNVLSIKNDQIILPSGKIIK